jgi:hypothetical protein
MLWSAYNFALDAKMKEGFGLTLVSATAAHRSVGDPIAFEIVHALIFVCLVVSYVYHHKRVGEGAPHDRRR